MTRINTVDPRYLTDQHLMAEYRELPMINAALKRTLASAKGIQLQLIPAAYTLNKGHVKFFYNKGEYLEIRYNALCDELKLRGFKLDEERQPDFDVFRDNSLYKNWTPTAHDHSVNLERLAERIGQKPEWYKFKGTPLTELDQQTLYFILGEYTKTVFPNQPMVEAVLADVAAVTEVVGVDPEAYQPPVIEYEYMQLNDFRRKYEGLSPLGMGWEIVTPNTIRRPL